MVTMAVRQTNLGQNPNEPNLLDVISPDRYTLYRTQPDAIRRTMRCELVGAQLLMAQPQKLRLSKSRTLYPDVVETLNAARTLVEDNFEVMVYTSDDPLIALESKRLVVLL